MRPLSRLAAIVRTHYRRRDLAQSRGDWLAMDDEAKTTVRRGLVMAIAGADVSGAARRHGAPSSAVGRGRKGDLARFRSVRPHLFNSEWATWVTAGSREAKPFGAVLLATPLRKVTGFAGGSGNTSAKPSAAEFDDARR